MIPSIMFAIPVCLIIAFFAFIYAKGRHQVIKRVGKQAFGSMIKIIMIGGWIFMIYNVENAYNKELDGMGSDAYLYRFVIFCVVTAIYWVIMFAIWGISHPVINLTEIHEEIKDDERKEKKEFEEFKASKNDFETWKKVNQLAAAAVETPVPKPQVKAKPRKKSTKSTKTSKI